MFKTQRHQHNSSILTQNIANSDEIISLYSTRKYSSKLLSDLNMTYSRLADNQQKFDKIKQDQIKYSVQENYQTFQQQVCKNCFKWKNFACQTKKILLELQNRFIEKQQAIEQKMKQLMCQKQKQIKSNYISMEVLKNEYQAKMREITNKIPQFYSGDNFKIKNQKQCQIKTTGRTLSQLQETLKKQNKFLKYSINNNDIQQHRITLKNLASPAYSSQNQQYIQVSKILNEKNKNCTPKTLTLALQFQKMEKLTFQNNNLKEYNHILIQQLRRNRILK